nr:2135_t:CDS:2 [Entrophospora candida]
MSEIENGMKFVDYPDEDFLFVDGTRLGSTIPSATSDSVVDGIENQIKNDTISSTASATSCKSSETMATNTPPGTPSTTTRNSANAGSGLFTLFESDSITKNNNSIDKINGGNDEKINEQIQQNDHLLKPSDQNDAQHLAQQPNNTITLVVPGEIESHKNSSYAPKQRDNSPAATKSSPSPQKKSSQSHKRALSTEIVYKLLGNNTASESTSYLDELNVIDSRSKRHDGKRKALSLMVDSFKSPSGQPNLSVLSNNTTLTTKEKRKTISATSSGSSNAAKKVMDWFRRKSLAKQDIPITIDNDNVEQAAASTPDLTSNNNNGRSSKNNIFKKPKNNTTNNNPSVIVTQPNSIANSSSSSRQSTMTSINLNVDAKLRVHNGALDQLALTERPPYEVFIVVKQTLLSMGIEIRREGEFKVKCLRRKRKGGVPIDNNFYSNNDNNGNKGTSQVSESTESLDVNTEKKRKKYSSTPFKTLLRRTSSNNTNQLASLHPIITTPSSQQQQQQQNKSEYLSPQTPDSSIIYGDPTVDSGEEVRFSVELCRIKNLPGLYIVDIKRLKGNRWSYKFLYHTLLDRLDLKGQSGYLTIGTSGDNFLKKEIVEEFDDDISKGLIESIIIEYWDDFDTIEIS